MPLVDLDEYLVTDPTTWRLSAIGSATAVVKIWDSTRLGLSPKLAFASTLLVIFCLIAARGLRRKSELDPGAKKVRKTTILFGRQLATKEVDVSDAAWVRARPIGYKTQLVVEVGTVGYSTKELVRVVSDKNQGIPFAEMLCARVALHLEISDKGYKPIA
ncbi:hypothetical protein [Paucibacter sp. DJ2R-2]|uniref:hypothetical protein n=1 Tax=Paucibacter sp. DJ2R-2 TaxID=2893558 RepID=UPI0021E3C86A|nr:hypothetical protein [Paucibacter sp. DJ2R-2]MCV2419345.1 hypothetical protein [Paucibacter sp. DJ4R-1]MCV2437751.1 hypothetical protein [Paucibacter sp. DJ2R-2]